MALKKNTKASDMDMSLDDPVSKQILLKEKQPMPLHRQSPRKAASFEKQPMLAHRQSPRQKTPEFELFMSAIQKREKQPMLAHRQPQRQATYGFELLMSAIQKREGETFDLEKKEPEPVAEIKEPEPVAQSEAVPEAPEPAEAVPAAPEPAEAVPEAPEPAEAVPAAPEPAVRQEKKKVTLKSLQAQGQIHVEVLQMLTQKLLLELFALRETDSIYSTKIGFSCHFYADKICGEKFSVYKNKTIAKNMIEKHIRSHIEEESKKGQHFFTNSLEFRRKQEEASKKKANAPLKKLRNPPPQTGNKPKAGDRQSSPVTEKSGGRKRKPTDDKERQTSDVQFVNERSSSKFARRSTSSENSLEAGSAQEVVRQEGDSRVPVPYSDHSYAVPPGVVPMPEPALSPSATPDSSVSSGVSLEEPGAPPENEDHTDALSGHPFATHEETVHETIAHEAMESDEDKKILNRIIQREKKREEIPQHTKDSAQSYITEIQTKKKNENYPLICKICNTGKVFTAASSLINHYRSHAGLTLFKCYCGLSFTRNHSLKYHRLIHEGKYNYLCEYCNRPFRHKSHYKEHLRKHTGETPFECTECDPVAKYKTRNTYKRHLKTHHGKILLRDGTINLSEEDFAKVRTKKYKKSAATGAAVRKSSSSSESPSSSSSPKVEPEELKPPTQQMPLPPVGTNLSGLNPVTSHASLGILSPMGAMQAAASGSLLGMNTAGHGLIYSGFPSSLQTSILVPQVTLGASQPATSIIVCQAPTMTLCQPTGVVSRDAQEQTYYTITGFAPGMVVGSAPSLFGAQPAYQQGSRTGDTDLSDCKPVGYITHR